MRVVFWNIERGMRLDDIKLMATDREAFIRRIAQDCFAKKHELQPEAGVGRPRTS